MAGKTIGAKTQANMAKTYEEVFKQFLDTFKSVALYKHRYDVFRDFVTMAAITFRNAIIQNEELEQEYLQIIHSYEKDDQQKFPQLLAILVELLEFEPKDVLGTLYATLELTSKDKGQFFTPSTISEFMAQILYGEELKHIDKPFLTLSEPACGAGGMVLAFVKTMIKHKHNPAEKLWVQCVDVDRLAALMCYVQLSLWHVPAEVVVGNTLSLEVREVWHTPAHYLGNWTYKLAQRAKSEMPEEKPEPSTKSQEVVSDAPKQEPLDTASSKPTQFDFGF